MQGKYHLGYCGANRENLAYEIVYYKDNKNLVIKFSIDGTEVKTTGAYLTKGLPLHPTHSVPKTGDTFPCKDGDTVELLEYRCAAVCHVKWLSDGTTGFRSIIDLRKGVNKHPHNWKLKVGQVFKVGKGLVTVVAYNSATNVEVKFEDGSITKTTSSALKLGNVGHPSSGLVSGYEFETNSGWKGTVVDYKNCHEVVVKWQDGSTESHPASAILHGGIKPLYQPSVAGIGYFGEGRFVSKAKKGKESAPGVILDYWRRMITRCYNQEEVTKNKNTYLNVEVCKDWLNFQNFAEWALMQPNWNLKNELDKDLFGNGSLYSPENCTFLPMEVNVFLADQYSRKVHDLPKGVQYIKPGVPNAKVGYVARCHTDKGREYLGYFDTPEQAFAAYKPVKEQYARILAERHKHQMTTAAYEKLMTFTITP